MTEANPGGRPRRRRRAGRALTPALIAVLAVAGLLAPAADAAVPVGSTTYNGTISGTLSEFNSLLGGYQATAQASLPVVVLVEPKVGDPNPAVRVLGVFTGTTTPLTDSRAGAIHFATNTQAFRIVPEQQRVSTTRVDLAQVQVDPAAGLLQVNVDPVAARTSLSNLFRTQASAISVPAQVLAGSMRLQFSPDGRSASGTFELGGNPFPEPGNPLFPVRRYQGTIQVAASGPVDIGTPGPGPVPGGEAGPGAGAPSDDRRCDGRAATVRGTDSGDRLTGTAGADVIAAGAGDDVVIGRGGDDVICLGPGDDRSQGGQGADRITGGPGADTLFGNAGRDTLLGGAGPDALVGQADGDRLLGGSGPDRLVGGAGHDVAVGGTGRDVCGTEARRLCP